MEAVVQAHTQELQSLFRKWERIADPCQRLLALLQTAREQEQALARYGCPHGSLCQELDKEDDAAPAGKGNGAVKAPANASKAGAPPKAPAGAKP